MGREIQALGAAGAKISQRKLDAERRIQSREEAVAQADRLTGADNEIADILRKAKAEGDLSHTEDLVAFGESVSKIRAKAITGFQGSAEGRLRLEERLAIMEGSYISQAAADGALLGKKKVDDLIGATVNRRRSEISLNPELLDDHINQTLKDLQSDFGTFDPAEEEVLKNAAIAEFGDAAATSYMLRGKSEKAREILQRPDISAAMGSRRQAALFSTMAQIESKTREAETAALSALTTAKTILGPDASEEEVRDAAGFLAGIAPDRPLSFVTVGNKILAMDKQTGELVNEIAVPTTKGAFMPPEEVEEAGFQEGTVVWRPAEGPPVKLAGPTQTPEDIQEIARAKEAGKLLGRQEFLAEIFGRAGLSPEDSTDLATSVNQSPAVLQPFGAGVAASEDAQSVARFLTASRRLLLIGDTATANSLLAQARFLAESSPEIRRQKELDSQISPELASELGVPLGTPLREVIGQLPRTPEEKRESGAAAAARGTGRVKGEEQLAFISEASRVIGDLLEEIKVDPGVVGIRGSLRSAGQTAIGVISDIGADELVDAAYEMTLTQTDFSLDEIFDMFRSPTLSTLDIMENTIGLILARLRTPQGRVPVDVIKRSIKDAQLTGLKGSTQIVNRLNFIMKNLQSRGQGIRGRFGIKTGMRRFRIKDGKLEQTN